MRLLLLTLAAAAVLLCTCSNTYSMSVRDGGASDGEGETLEPDVIEELPEEEGEGGSDGDDDGQDRVARTIPRGSFQNQGGTGPCTLKCNDGYNMYGSKHTVCNSRYAKSNDCTLSGLTAKEKAEAIAFHNKVRGAAGASNMMKMHWSNELAMIAQKLADSCKYEHDPKRASKECGHFPVGQNIARGQDNINDAMTMWAEEKKYFVHGEGCKGGTCGHYTQMVNYRANTFGCGHSFCNTKQKPFHFWVCNYAMGQTRAEIQEPYAKGGFCSKCSSCDNKLKLCNCGKEVCWYGTKPKSNNVCQCDCPNKKFPALSGNKCQNVDCSVTCKVKNTKDDCLTVGNLRGLCPVLCKDITKCN